MGEAGVERSLRIASEAVGLAFGALILWQYLDPAADPKELLVDYWNAGRSWLSERLRRAESFRRTLDDVRSLPEQESA